MWTFYAPALSQLQMHNSNCVLIPLGKPLQNTESPHLTPWRASFSPSVMVAVNSFCRCTAVEQMRRILDRGMFSRHLSTPPQYITCPKADLLITALCSNETSVESLVCCVRFSCCLCGCKLSYLFKHRWWRKAIYVACSQIFHVFKEFPALYPSGFTD